MNGSKLDQLLPLTESAPGEPLPSGFAAQVLRQAKVVKQAAQAHWRALVLASLASVILSGIIGQGIAQTRTENTPPALHLFQPQSGSAPFATR